MGRRARNWIAAASAVSLAVSGGVLAVHQWTSAIDPCPSVALNGTVTPAPTPASSGVASDWRLCNLTNANFAGLNLTGVNLTGADLTHANFTNATLTDTDLRDTVVNATLAPTVLTGLRASGVVGVPLLPSKWQLLATTHVGTVIAGPHVDLSALNLSGTDFSTVPDLTGISLSGANLTTATFQFQILTDADLTNTTLTGAVMSSVQSGGLQLAGATMSGFATAGLHGTPASLPTGSTFSFGPGNIGTVVGPGVDLSNSVARGNLAGVDLTGATLGTATFIDVSSGGITGIPTSLPTGWKLIGGYLLGPAAVLNGATLNGLNLTGVDLTGALLEGADFTDAVLTGATLTDAAQGLGVGGPPAAYPSAAWTFSANHLIGPGADLTAAQLTGADLTGVSLVGTNLTMVRSGNITGTPSALSTGWKLTGGYLVGPVADLTDTDLTGLDLRGADLTETKLTGATLTRVKTGGSAGEPYPPVPNWLFRNGFLLGPTVDLTGRDLAGTNLDGVDLFGATLTAVKSGNVTGVPATLPAGWKLVGGYLVGPGANLSGANLSGLDLRGAVLTGITAQATQWTNTTCPDGKRAATRTPATCLGTPKAAPSAVTSVTVSFPAAGRLRLAWAPPVINGAPITSYQYCRAACATATNWKGTGNTGGIQNTFVTLSGLAKGSTTRVMIRAVNVAGKGAAVTVAAVQPI